MLPGQQRAAAVIGALRAAGQTVAAAESLTGGLVTATLTAVSGSSDVVRGGLVVYATELKHTLARVPEDLLESRGPVDPDVAAALAAGARDICGASLGLGLTGVAGPAAQHGHRPGTWFVALADRNGHILLRSAVAPTPGSAEADALTRDGVRREAVDAALDLLAEIATGTGPEIG
ncbi:MAG: CinA family protein [Nakamurella sp.]